MGGVRNTRMIKAQVCCSMGCKWCMAYAYILLCYVIPRASPSELHKHPRMYTYAIHHDNPCYNIYIDHMKISHLTGSLAISSPRGDIRVLNSVFEHSNSATGGVYVNASNIVKNELKQHIVSKSQYNITFEKCVFHNNTNSYNGGKSKTRRSSRHAGGGLLLMFVYAKNVHINIFNCNFTGNQAPWGGGLFVGFRTRFTSNILVVKDTVFASNTASHGGGGMDIGFYEIKYHKGHHTRSNFCRATSRATKVSPCMVQSRAVASRLKHVCDMLREIETILFSGDLSYETCDKSCLRRSDKSCSVYGGLNDDNINNSVSIENVTFQNNSARYGGGNTIFSDLGYQISHWYLNNVTFKNCTWKDNLANFSTAVDVSPNIFDNIAGGFPVSTAFYDCRFVNNKVLSNSRHKNTTKLFYRSGTVMITALPVKFGGETIFANNVGTALHVVATRVTFDWWSNVIFENNSGSEGGALALVGMATLLFNSNSTFLFVNNSADFVGGAIYWYSVDQHDYFSSHTCFLKREMHKTKNVSFSFINNTAHSGIGNSIFATTLLPCRCSSHNNSHNLLDVFKCVAKFPDLVLKDIATYAHKFNLDKVKNSSLMITPGIIVPLGATVYDEGHHNVTHITVFQNSIMQDNNSTITLAPSYKYNSLCEVNIYGRPGSTGKLLVKTDNVQGISTVVDIKLTHCPPGFVLINDTKCECGQDNYFKIECKFPHAYIRKGYWAGYLDVNNATGPTPANLWTSECPLAFCSYDKHNKIRRNLFLLPKTANKTSLDDFICNSYRTGKVCGQCREGFSVFFHSKLYSCKKVSSLCNYGILFYVLSELLPLTLLFIAILVMNISFTSGAVNGFILFAQVIDLLYIDANGLTTFHQASWVVPTYQFIYGFFNLDFFSGEFLSFCLWEGATVLDVLKGSQAIGIDVQ